MWYVKEDAKEIIATKSSFTNVILKLENQDVADIYDSIHMLLSILNHISNHKAIRFNHLSTLQNNISQNEKFVLFYFYLSTSHDFHLPEQVLLYEFFNEMDRMAFFVDLHSSWVKDLPK